MESVRRAFSTRENIESVRGHHQSLAQRFFKSRHSLSSTNLSNSVHGRSGRFMPSNRSDAGLSLGYLTYDDLRDLRRGVADGSSGAAAVTSTLESRLAETKVCVLHKDGYVVFCVCF
mmetsp:Transcript_33026/g.44020  ORF Transcript_33026/g.44020 Transcript_33026/m.44020 type:complete len:117 (-) Transcript_33026:175-525(-)